MRFKPARKRLALAGLAAAVFAFGSWDAMSQTSGGQTSGGQTSGGQTSGGQTNGAGTKREAASISIVRGGDPMEISVKTNGGGVTYFGGIFIEFGDGQRQLLCGPGQSCGAVQLQHRYMAAGKYRVKMVGLGEPDRMPLAEAVVLVPAK